MKRTNYFEFTQINLSQMNKLAVTIRSKCQAITSDKSFDQFIIFVIAVNSLFLAMSDYSSVDSTGALVSDGSWRNTLISESEIVFTIIFTIECVLKIIAVGFRGKDSYLSDPWNWLDFVVVITGFVFIHTSCIMFLHHTHFLLVGYPISQASQTYQPLELFVSLDL
jgi:voltage-dependent calcium channel L type alpha-1D